MEDVKTLKQKALPAGLLFAISAAWMVANWLGSIVNSMFVIPSHV